jgi:hypothetical protein
MHYLGGVIRDFANAIDHAYRGINDQDVCIAGQIFTTRTLQESVSLTVESTPENKPRLQIVRRQRVPIKTILLGVLSTSVACFQIC